MRLSGVYWYQKVVTVCGTPSYLGAESVRCKVCVNYVYSLCNEIAMQRGAKSNSWFRITDPVNSLIMLGRLTFHLNAWQGASYRFYAVDASNRLLNKVPGRGPLI